MKIAGVVLVTVTVFSLLLSPNAFAQGPLEPGSGPAATMKSLEDLWSAVSVLSNKLAVAEESMTALSNRLEMTYSLLDGTFSWAVQAAESATSASSKIAALASSQTLVTRSPVTLLVDTNGDTGYFTSMALTSQGFPAVSYFRADDKDLMYAEWNGVAWSIQRVYTNGDTGYWTSLAMQPGTGYPAISFYDSSQKNLMYAGWSGNSWVIHTVDSVGDVGFSSSLAFTAVGMPAISYYDRDNGRVKYAIWNGGGWTYDTLASNVGSNTFVDTSLAFTAGGTVPAIAFYDPNAGFIRYAFWTNSAWDISVVDTATATDGAEISLSFTPAGEPAMCYHDHSGRGLVYSEHVPGNWNIQTVDSGLWIGLYADLAFNAAGRPCISYQDVNIEYLKYAEWNGESWRKQITCRNFSGQYSSLAFTTMGHPIISHLVAFGVYTGNLALTEILPAP